MMQGLVTSQEYFNMKKKLEESSNMLVNARSVQPRFQEVPIFGRNLDTSFNQYSSLDANKYNTSFSKNNLNNNSYSNNQISKNKIFDINKSNNSNCISTKKFTNLSFNTEMSLTNTKTFYNNKTTPYNSTNISHLILSTTATPTDNNTSKEFNTPHNIVMYLSDVLSYNQKKRARKSNSESQIANENKAFVKELKAVKFPSLPTLIISKTRVVSDSNNYATSTELTKYDPSDNQTTNGTSLVTTHVTTLDATGTVNKNDDSYNSSSSNNSTRKHRKVVSITGDKHKRNWSKKHKDEKIISATIRRSSRSVSSSEEDLPSSIKVRPSRKFLKLNLKASDDLTSMAEVPSQGSRTERDQDDTNQEYFTEKDRIEYLPIIEKNKEMKQNFENFLKKLSKKLTRGSEKYYKVLLPASLPSTPFKFSQDKLKADSKSKMSQKEADKEFNKGVKDEKSNMEGIEQDSVIKTISNKMDKKVESKGDDFKLASDSEEDCSDSDSDSGASQSSSTEKESIECLPIKRKKRRIVKKVKTSFKPNALDKTVWVSNNFQYKRRW